MVKCYIQIIFITNFTENQRTQLVLKNPKLKFFKSTSVDVDYFGPPSLSDLSSFIDKQMGRLTAAAKGV